MDVFRAIDPFFDWGGGGKTTKLHGVLGEGARRPSGGGCGRRDTPSHGLNGTSLNSVLTTFLLSTDALYY